MIRILNMKVVRIFAAIEVSAATYRQGHFLFHGQLFLWTYSQIGAPTVRQDNIFPPSICRENSGKKYASSSGGQLQASNLKFLPTRHLVASTCRVFWPVFDLRMFANNRPPERDIGLLTLVSTSILCGRLFPKKATWSLSWLVPSDKINNAGGTDVLFSSFRIPPPTSMPQIHADLQGSLICFTLYRILL
ncbi:hypothetical protein ARMSODRAFT_1073100 [Armillaria solidipes]|uniref:Uncharacterized protein n=1 Tax=Armillaria solidipes TaxID=1076256 RepID=A0A2H3AKA3_9AGAR|nr:hypothetical protein ARMSODRAFT_1073100 [Armillaria solidipes]